MYLVRRRAFLLVSVFFVHSAGATAAVQLVFSAHPWVRIVPMISVLSRLPLSLGAWPIS